MNAGGVPPQRRVPLRATHLALFVLLRFDRKLLSPMLRTSSQVIDAGLQPFRPSVKVHRRQRIVVGVFLPQIQALALADERTSVRGHIDHVSHGNLPNRLVLLFNVFGYILDMLHTTLVCNNVIFHFSVPDT